MFSADYTYFFRNEFEMCVLYLLLLYIYTVENMPFVLGDQVPNSSIQKNKIK